MNKILSFLLSILAFSSCLVEHQNYGNVDSELLSNHCKYLLLFFNDKVGEHFTKVLAVDAFEALTDEEKSNPLYSAFQVDYDYWDGSKHYEGYGAIMPSQKRLREQGSTWATHDFMFLCRKGQDTQSDALWEFSFVDCPISCDLAYLPETCRLWMEGEITVRYEFRAEGKCSNGFSEALFTLAPIQYDTYKRTRNGVYRYETYYPDGRLCDWVEMTEVDSEPSFRTSRDSKQGTK